MVLTVTEQLAACLTEIGKAPVSDGLRDKVARHLFDTIGAILAGLPLQESTALAAALTELNESATPGLHGPLGAGGLRGPLGPTILHLSAAARCTEVDDIHLASCITPSAIIVPVALVTAAHRPQTSGADVIAACLAGYEAIIRLGLAIDGPGILYQGLWPTYLCAGIGSAATASALLGLTTGQTAQALAIASAMAGGANARSDSPCAKWLMAGQAAQSGVLAAIAAKRGFLGDLGLLGERWGKLFGVTLDQDILIQAPKDRRQAESLAMKPYCGARQMMAALAAFQSLIERPDCAPESLGEIIVEVPNSYLAMIDRKTLPVSRQESFADLRYQFALAAFAPDRLLDVAREMLPIDSRFPTLAGKITICHGADLDQHYPQHWPARVTVTDQDGARHCTEIVDAPGDAPNALGWDGLITKFTRVSGRSPAHVAQIATACQSLAQAQAWPNLVTLIDQAIADCGPSTVK